MIVSRLSRSRFILRAAGVALGLGAVLGAAACFDADRPIATAPDASASLSPAAAAIEAELQHVARAVAGALAQKDARLAVRDALRDSPWDSHQVVLQELVATPRGRVLLAAAARAAGETPERLGARIAALPPLDLSVPSREERRSWRGTAGVVVRASLNPEGGRVFSFDSGPRGNGGATFLLAPAEPRAERNVKQAVGKGDVIQSAEDGQDAVTYTWVDPDGTVTRLDLDRLMAGEEPGFAVIQTVGQDTTFLDYVKVYYGDAGDDLELNIDAEFYGPDGTSLGRAEYDHYSFPENGSRWPHFPLIGKVVPDQSAARVNIHVWEDDCGCWGNDDDHYGTRDFYWNDRGQVRTLADSDGDTDIELDWIARAPSVLTSVTVGGAWLYVGDSQNVYARARDQYGFTLSGYTVSAWSVDNSYVASITGTLGNRATLRGNSVGQTYVRATIDGVTGAGFVNVQCPVEEPTDPDPIDPEPIYMNSAAALPSTPC
ncbi:MAG TPA: hypothetical protein VHG91_04485 [Longimicrobium sp.]|nr:hypothetical protein [Longimicrobium sp.]